MNPDEQSKLATRAVEALEEIADKLGEYVELERRFQEGIEERAARRNPRQPQPQPQPQQPREEEPVSQQQEQEPDHKYVIRTDSGTASAMTYDEVVHGVQMAISYRLGHSEGIAASHRAVVAAAQAATHWLEASLTKTEVVQ